MTAERKEQLAQIFNTVSKLPDAERERILYIAVGMEISSALKEGNHDGRANKKSLVGFV